MTTTPVECPVPPNSRAAALLGEASFFDCWSVRSDRVDQSALALFLAAAARTPRWVNLAMAARNRVAQAVGLKHLGRLDHLDPQRAPDRYAPGDRVGIFTLFEQGFDEALLGDRDKHLDVVLSVHRARVPGQASIQVSLTTIVHVKNLLGRLYMLPVTPAHRIIAPAVLGRLAGQPGSGHAA